MGKKKEESESNHESMDLFEDDESAVELSVEVEADIAIAPCQNAKENRKLVNKRRLDDYLERKWFRENGWDDDDDLFSDEYFSADRK